MSDNWKKVRDKAALECYRRLCPHQERHEEYMARGKSTTAKAFLEGYDYAVQNDPRVKALVEALKKLEIPEGKEARNYTELVAHEALKAFEGGEK